MTKQRALEYIKKYRLEGFNKPKKTPLHPTKSHIVVVSYKGQYKVVRFGQQGVKGAGSKPKSEKQKLRRKLFKARHKRNIERGPLYAAYWSDKVKW